MDCEDTTVKSVLMELSEESTGTTATQVSWPGRTGKSPAKVEKVNGSSGVLSSEAIGSFGPSAPTPTLVNDHDAAYTWYW